MDFLDVAADTYDQGLVDSAQAAAQLDLSPPASLRDLPPGLSACCWSTRTTGFRPIASTWPKPGHGGRRPAIGLPLPETHPGADSWVIYDSAVGATALRAVALNSSAGDAPPWSSSHRP